MGRNIYMALVYLLGYNNIYNKSNSTSLYLTPSFKGRITHQIELMTKQGSNDLIMYLSGGQMYLQMDQI